MQLHMNARDNTCYRTPVFHFANHLASMCAPLMLTTMKTSRSETTSHFWCATDLHVTANILMLHFILDKSMSFFQFYIYCQKYLATLNCKKFQKNLAQFLQKIQLKILLCGSKDKNWQLDLYLLLCNNLTSAGFYFHSFKSAGVSCSSFNSLVKMSVITGQCWHRFTF